MTNHTAIVDWAALYAALSEPFDPALIQYRAGATNRDQTQALALPYVEPRAYEDRLNQLVPGNWNVTFAPWGEDRIICNLTIHGITRSSTGEGHDSPNGIAGTSAEAQAFKRACTKFGLGRHLYAHQPTWMPYDPKRRAVAPPPTSDRVTAPTRTTPQRHARQASDRIGPARGSRMASELQRLGVPNALLAEYAGTVTGRPIPDLSHLTDREARMVWREATAAPSKPARHRPGR